MASWALVLGLTSWQTNHTFGVVVHDVIAQSTIFLICAVVLIWLVRDFVFARNWRLTICCAVLFALFLVNILFVAASRADIVVLPVLAVLLGWRWWHWRGALLACVAVGFLAAGVYAGSPYLRERIQHAIDDVEIYRTTHVHNDVGDHIEFLKNRSHSFARLRLLVMAPVLFRSCFVVRHSDKPARRAKFQSIRTTRSWLWRSRSVQSARQCFWRCGSHILLYFTAQVCWLGLAPWWLLRTWSHR